MKGKGTSGVEKKNSTDLTTPEAVEQFREAAEEFTKRGTRSKAAAMKVLIEAGIYTEAGKLSKNYRS